MQAVHFELSLQAEQTFSAFMLCGRQITIASTACPMLAFIAQARRRTATAASSEKLGLYIYTFLLYKLYEVSTCFQNSETAILKFEIIAFFGQIRQSKTVP
jgi:hypothetical protein